MPNLNNIVFFLFLLLITTTSFAQSLAEKNAEELKKMQTEAVANENYELADKIEKQLKRIEANKAKIAKLEAEKKDAILIEDYAKAEEIENQIKALKIGSVYPEKLNVKTPIERENPTTKTALLCGKKWNLVSSYTVSGKKKKPIKQMNKNLPCTLDNTLIFNKDFTFIIDEGVDLCRKSSSPQISGRWFWNSSKTAITLKASSGKKAYINFFNKIPERPIRILNENQLELVSIITIKSPTIKLVYETTETYTH